jgi:hypothetical protein
MMKSDASIKTLVYGVVAPSALAKAVTGIVSKIGRPDGSTAEDIVISVLDGDNGQLQQFIVNVNIYVADVLNDKGKYLENSKRVEALSNQAISLFESYIGPSYRMELTKQRVLPVEDKNERVINNRVLLTYVNI